MGESFSKMGEKGHCGVGNANKEVVEIPPT